MCVLTGLGVPLWLSIMSETIKLYGFYGHLCSCSFAMGKVMGHAMVFIISGSSSLAYFRFSLAVCRSEKKEELIKGANPVAEFPITFTSYQTCLSADLGITAFPLPPGINNFC